MTRRAWGACGAIVAVALAVAPRAGAVEREHQLGADVGGAVLVIADKSTPDVGAGVGVHYTYGLSDAFNFMVDGSWSLVAVGETDNGNPHTPKTRPATVTSIDAGIGYVLDILQWVPWAGILVGGYALNGGTVEGTKFLPGAAIALGVDYRISRDWAIGVSARQHAFTLMATYPSYTQAFARVQYTWGW